MASFPTSIKAILLAGGHIKDLPESEPPTLGKGHILIGNVPMAARALKALKEAKRISSVTLVTPLKKEELEESFKGADQVEPAGNSLVESLKSGMTSLLGSTDPVMIAAGDLPFLTAESIDNFVDLCSKKPEGSLWYGFVNKKASQAKYPSVKHTWVKLSEGTFCGSGLVVMRPEVVKLMEDCLRQITEGRKNPLKLANLLGWKTLIFLLLRMLTVPMAQEAANRLLKTICFGIDSPYAETSYNVDDYASLLQARKDAEKMMNN